jgi:hypothetical protein
MGGTRRETPEQEGRRKNEVTTEERFQRIESILDRVVTTQLQIDETMATLADSHIKTQEELRTLAVAQKESDAAIKDLTRKFEAYLNRRPQ